MAELKIEVEDNGLAKQYQGEVVKEANIAPFTKLILKIEGLAKKSTVVDTGRLRASISHKIDGDSAVVGTNVQYAPFIEFGTAKMQSRHMEGESRVLGQGMLEYTIESMSDELKDYEVNVVSNIEKEMSN